MFVSYKWLAEYVDLAGITPGELAEKITRSGIEVEGVDVLNEGMKGVVIGHVVEKEKHPDAEKLNKCQVDLGNGEIVQIICGAKNVDKGQKVAVATVGAVLPGNFKIKKAKLRGEVSNGMICSLQELGFEAKLVAKEYSEGIFVFPSDVEVGVDALQQLNLDDAVLELGLTPNRADAMSMLGVAHEVAAILNREVKYPEISYESIEEKAENAVAVKVEAPEDNPLYIAKVIKNVTIAPSPLWMQSRLMAAGIRPHNNVVDITNFVLLEYGQPLHAFDYDRFGSKEILVRRAKEGEKIVTLDDQERTLTAEHLVITNGTEPVALAGVMGGANSEVQSDTKTILLESALFNGQRIRISSKDHGLRSEASARYEKGIDPNRVHAAAERAAQLISLYAGGEVMQGSVQAQTATFEPAIVTTTVEKVNRVLGMNISSEEMKSIFERLQFGVVLDNSTLTVTVPTRRGDITIEEDLVEEIARLYGYDNIPTTLPIGQAIPGKLTDYQEKRRKVRRYLEGTGLFQAITYSLTNEEKAPKYALEVSELTRLALPMSEERSVLRLSLLPHLLDALKYNLARQIDQVGLYEIGSVFLSQGKDQQPLEKERLSAAITGLWHSHSWQAEKKPVDFYVVKGIVDGLVDLLGLTKDVQYKQAKRDGMHPGRTAEIYIGEKLVGFIGQVHPTAQKDLDLTETYVFELSLVDLLSVDIEETRFEVIPRYPSITRDIALVVDKNIVAGDIEKVITNAGGKMLKEISVFDLYEGDRLEEGKKSVAFSLRYFDPERTLTDEDVTKAHEKVLSAVEDKVGATLRG